MNTKSTFRKNANDYLTHTHGKNGITLIALVVTIVVLIILAVISINGVFGEDGLIASAERGSIEHTHATVWEAMEMEYSNYWIDKVNIGGDLITYLQSEDRNIIGKELQGTGYVINVENLLGTRMSLGNGTDGNNDVYKLEPLSTGEANITKVASTGENIKLAEENKEESEYQVKYYGPSGERKLGILGDSISSEVKVENENLDITKGLATSPAPKEYYLVGDQIHYEIRVENIGDVEMTDIYIKDELNTKESEEPYTPGNKLILEGNNSGKVQAKDNQWYIEELGVDEEIIFNYYYTVQKEDVGEPIKNAITSLTGTPKPIPKGHKIPEVEVQVPVVGSVPVKKILHMTRWEDNIEGNYEEYLNLACLHPRFELYKGDEMVGFITIDLVSTHLWVHPDGMEWPSEPVSEEYEKTGTFTNIPVGEYKLKETTTIQYYAAGHEHTHDERIYDVSVLSETETEIKLNNEVKQTAEFEDTCCAIKRIYIPKGCVAGPRSFAVHVSWKGWEDESSHPVLGKDIIIKWEKTTVWYGTGVSNKEIVWNIDDNSRIEGEDGWYESIKECWTYTPITIQNASGEQVKYGTMTDESSNNLTLKLDNGDNVKITMDSECDRSKIWGNSREVLACILIEKID